MFAEVVPVGIPLNSTFHYSIPPELQNKLAAGHLVEVPMKELQVARKIHLVFPSHRQLSHAARAFLDVVKSSAEA